MSIGDILNNLDIDKSVHYNLVSTISLLKSLIMNSGESEITNGILYLRLDEKLDELRIEFTDLVFDLPVQYEVIHVKKFEPVDKFFSIMKNISSKYDTNDETVYNTIFTKMNPTPINVHYAGSEKIELRHTTR